MADAPLITNRRSRNRYYFRYYRSITEFNEAGKRAYQEFVGKNVSNGIDYWQSKKGRKLDQRARAFTGGNNVKELNEGTFTEFIEPDVLSSAIDAFDEILANIDMGGAFKKARLIITERSTGIFDFSLASAGLYLVMEFFSEKLKKDSPFEFVNELPGIVPNLYVDKNPMGDFWYTAKSGEKYQMTQQAKGTEAMAMDLPGAKKEYRTTTKKSYVTFEKKGGVSRYVDLYVGCGGLQSLEPSGMLARALPVMMAARYFESMRIKTRINASRMFTDGNDDDRMINFCWTIKDFGDDLDFTRIAIDTADTRYFRWNNWANVSAIMQKDFNVDSAGYGTTIYGGEAMLETGNRYKNWYFDQMEQLLVPEIQIPRPLMMFGGLDNPPETWDYTGNQTDRTLLRVKEEFFRMLDIVDFQFNNSVNVCQRIYKRRVEENKESISSYKLYITNTLSMAYSYPTKGDYADDVVQQEAMLDLYDEKISQMGTFLTSLTEPV